MNTTYIKLILLSLLFSSCSKNMICPAYQSSFIFDKTELERKFSIFEKDSTIRVMSASKNNYLIAVPESYKKRTRKLQTIEMKQIIPEIIDSLNLLDAEIDSIGIDSVEVEVDSTSAITQDSVYVITKLKEKYNLDQDLYMWYLRELLLLPDVRISAENEKYEKEQEELKNKEEKKKKGFFEFLRKLFKKKNIPDSTNMEVIDDPYFDTISDGEESMTDPDEFESEEVKVKPLRGKARREARRKEKASISEKREEDN